MLLFTHPVMLAHAPPRGHPERPARLQAVLEGLVPLKLTAREAPMAARAEIARVHAGAYIDSLEAAFARPGGVALDPDTFVSPASREVAYRAAGAVVAAVNAVLADEDEAAFCAVRPPGHHAEPARAMGFCLFDNAAIGALHALAAHGLSRVAVVDIDVHHGNGVEAVAQGEPRLFYASAHQAPFYPGTGQAGVRGPAGNILNVPLPAGTDGPAWRAAMEKHVLPALDAFAPELLIVCAGFDAHADDPLAGLALTEEDYAWAGAALRRLALRRCNGKVVSTLEGGYHLAALKRAVAAYVEAQQRG
ncbi:MAG: histone deacetylase family protein [Hyphomonadaceae bacterium]